MRHNPTPGDQKTTLSNKRIGARTIAVPMRLPGASAVTGITLALALAVALGATPLSALIGTTGTARAQDTAATDLSAPSDADRAALRYFAREGDVDRLEAELRRLRALYPNWQPPRDLLDPQGEDLELQRVYDLVGEQRFDEARAAIAERRQRDPTYEPPARLVELLQVAEIRRALRAASDADEYREVLRIAEENERILTCEDVDSIWRVAEAFAETDRPRRAFDAYAYVINSCLDQQEARAASLQKAAETLEPILITELFALGQTDEDGVNEFAAARLEIVRGAVARAGEDASITLPPEWLTLLADHARTGVNLDDAMLVGFYLYRRNLYAEAAEWFRFALESGFGASAAEAYILALRATGDSDDAFLAREVAYQWRQQTPELMEVYLNAMASLLTADRDLPRTFDDVEQISVNRYVPVVIEQRDPNGAQALGWYAFNTCQFIIAEEWFISAANWVPTDSSIFGLAVTRLRLGDLAGFDEVVEEWGSVFPSVQALSEGAFGTPGAPLQAEDDPTNEIGLSSVICDPAEQAQLRRLL
ncbi:MAG: hypothetical protein AAFW98_12505, partial [Pseudomonadota bacterium]